MASTWEKAISILAGNLNSGRSYLITAVKTAHCATSLFSLPKIRKVSPFPLLLPFFAVLKRQLSRHRQSDWLDWLGLFWPILLVVQANPLIRAQSTMVGFALNGYWQGFSTIKTRLSKMPFLPFYPPSSLHIPDTVILPDWNLKERALSNLDLQHC